MTEYLTTAVVATGVQLFLLLGPGLLLALAMDRLAAWVQRLSLRKLGPRIYLRLFGWLGTTVHEAGHALFCLLFGHRIAEVKWFDLQARDGRLGHVFHEYRRGNLYQSIGNFFIGIGPILLGTAVIWLAGWLLLGGDLFQRASFPRFDARTLTSGDALVTLGSTIGEAALALLGQLFTVERLTDWRLYLFLYLAFAVGSAITLSRADLRGAWRGFVPFVGLLLLLNLIAVAVAGSASLTAAVTTVSQWYSGAYAAMLFALLLNLLAAALLLLLPSRYRLT